MKIILDNINNIPVFIIQDVSHRWQRVYCAQYKAKKHTWYIPAYAPFLEPVLFDLKQIMTDDDTFTAEAQNYIDTRKTKDYWVDVVNQLKITFPTKSYKHQLEGLVDILYNYRWILKYEMGCGKSKIVIDQINYLKLPTLVISPLIGLDNWVDETKRHSGGQLTAIAIKGATRAKKLEAINVSINYDVRVITYGMASLYGLPTLYPEAMSIAVKAMMIPHNQIRKTIMRVNDKKLQAKYIAEWVKGRKPASIKQEIDAYLNGKIQWLWDTGYRQLVADESHRIKTIGSNQTGASLALAKQAERRVELTGTLSHGDPRDLYPQLKYLNTRIIAEDYKSYCNKYVIYNRHNEHLVVGYRNLNVINKKVNRVSSEKKLAECVDLPPRTFTVILFDLSPKQKKDYNTAVKSWEITKPDAEPLEIQNSAVRIAKLLQLCSGFVYVPDDEGVCNDCKPAQIRKCVSGSIRPGTKRCVMRSIIGPIRRLTITYDQNPKLKALEDLLTDLLPNAKVIIWAVFTEELDTIGKALEAKNIGYVRVDGKTSHKIQSMAKIFNTDPKCKVYLAQIRTGIAITLNSAKYTIYYSRDWSVDNRYQSLFRNYRIGQTKKTVVYDLCARNAIELQQLAALRQKAHVADIMTKRINCVLCRKYKECIQQGTQPWSKECVLDTTAVKVIAKAWSI